MSDLFIGIDLGGTNAKAGIVDSTGHMLIRKEKPLKDLAPEKVVADLVECASEALKETNHTWKDVVCIGIGSPGGIQDGCVTAAANFPTWKMVPLADMISKAANGTRAILVNDADAAVAAEVWVGAARKRGVKNMVMLTLGTGVGAGVVINGEIISGATGLIEGGHMIVERDGDACGCTQRGCLEVYASASAVARRAKEAANKSGVNSVLSGKEGFGSKEVFDAAMHGDEVATKVIDEACDYLGFACVNVCRLLDTELIVFAGGMTRAGDFLFDRLRKAYSKYAWTKLPNNVQIVGAEVGDDSGIIGAAAMAKRHVTGSLV
eukprot:comp25017_c0_seq1/m.46935 comp25017_c0_seq1/g.46935  ORF comp25017_c0_seq1/g.46935 comp25017_c0_seq1/m.46935 type:complete len:321 (-) comp25017_c0_seq1:532-1494(-)